MRERSEIEGRLNAIGFDEVELHQIQVELLLDIRDLLQPASESAQANLQIYKVVKTKMGIVDE